MSAAGDPPRTGRRWPALPRDRWLRVLVVLFLVSLPLVTVRVYAVDEIQYFVYLPSVIHGGDLDFENEYRGLLADRQDELDWRALLEVARTPEGYLPNYAGVGCALLWLPGYLVAEVAARLGPWPADGLSWPYQAAVSYSSALYAFLGLLLLFGVARRVVGDGPALAGVLLTWWATQLTFYMYVTPPMSHATSFFAVSAFVAAWASWRRQPTLGRSLLLGAIAGLMSVVREQNVLLLVLPAFDVATRSLEGWRRGDRDEAARSARIGGVMAAGFAVPLLPQLLVWYRLFGSIGPPPMRVAFMEAFPRHLPAVLLSSERGLLLWHPVWIAGLVGLALLARRRPRLGWPLLLAVATQLWFLGSAANWSGGMAFGQRRLVASLFVVALGAAEIARRVPRPATLAAGVLLVWLNLSLVIQFGTGMIPRQGDVSWGHILRNHVVEVPRRLGGILGRYLFERSDFWDGGGEPDSRS